MQAATVTVPSSHPPGTGRRRSHDPAGNSRSITTAETATAVTSAPIAAMSMRDAGTSNRSMKATTRCLV
jgi:hypothetical protein